MRKGETTNEWVARVARRFDEATAPTVQQMRALYDGYEHGGTDDPVYQLHAAEHAAYLVEHVLAVHLAMEEPRVLAAMQAVATEVERRAP